MKIVVLVVLAVVAWFAYGKWRAAARAHYIERFRFHDAVVKKFREARPGLTPEQERLVFEALREWFQVCRLAGKRFVSMPSQVVDDAWHAFILFTRGYQQFCERSFGRFLHHTPAEAMISRTVATDGIKRSWRLACARARIDPRTPDKLPLLFAIDGMLGIANGFHYSLVCQPNGDTYCASGIGCSSGCGAGSDGSSDGDAGGGDGGGCGGGGD